MATPGYRQFCQHCQQQKWCKSITCFASCCNDWVTSGLFCVLMFCRGIRKTFTRTLLRCQWQRTRSAYSIVHRKRRPFCTTHCLTLSYVSYRVLTQNSHDCQSRSRSATSHSEQICCYSSGSVYSLQVFSLLLTLVTITNSLSQPDATNESLVFYRKPSNIAILS